MSDADDPLAGSVNPPPLPAIPTPGINDTLIALPSHAVLQDLSSESLLASAPRTSVAGRQVPMVGGIPLLAKLGQGGMGAVYLGYHPRLKVEVAVKILPTSEGAQLPAAVQRFFREGQLAAKVKSPHLVSVLDVNEEHGLFYLVLDYIAGPSAGNYLRSVQKAGAVGLDEATALSVCLAATEGLRCAHAQNVIHRDVKPDNILIPQDRASGKLNFELAKLADLGLARASDSDLSLTNVETTLGTPGFLAPEQATDAKNAGKPADIFAMGATLYTLLCGRPPFIGKTAVSTIVESMQNPHPPVAQFRPDVSPPLAQLIDRCLEKEPEQRYADADALFGALNDCRPTARLPPAPTAPVRAGQWATAVLQPPVEARMPTAARGAELSPQIFAKAKAPARKKLRWLALLAAPVLLCAAWLAWTVLRHPEPKREGKLLAPTPAPDTSQAELDRLKADAAKQQAEAERLRALADDKSNADAEVARLANQKADEAARRAAAATAALETELQNDWARTNKSLRDDLNSAQTAVQKARQQAKHSADALNSAQQAESKSKTDADNKKQALNAANTALQQAKNNQNSCFATWQSDEQTVTQLQNTFPLNKQKIQTAKENHREAGEALRQAQKGVSTQQTAQQNAQTAWQNANQAYTACTTNRIRAEDDARNDAKAAAAADDAVRKSMAKLQDFELQDGQYTVETPPEIVLHDGRRNKDLALSISYPITAGAEVFPVILFSPNFRAAKGTYTALCHYWSSHGYVCIQPFPADAVGAGQKLEDLPHNPLADPLFLENRVRDLSFILDSWPALKEKIPALKTAINERAVGVSGHVAGALTAQLAAGVASGLFDGEQAKSLPDKRVSAVLLLSPPGHDVAGLTNDSWKNFTLPLLNITGTKDGGAGGQSYEFRKDPYVLSPKGDKYDLVLDGAQHGLGLLPPENPGQRDALKLASLNFWEAYLRNDASAKGYLRSDALPQYAKGKLTLDNK